MIPRADRASRRCATWVVALIFLSVAPVAGADLKAGVARVEVTPPVGSLMYGYGARGTNVSTGVRDPLFAKALVLDDGEAKVGIVTLDLGSFPKENADNVRALLLEEADIEHITIKATTEGGYGADSATRVEVGAGERLVNQALINLLLPGRA